MTLFSFGDKLTERYFILHNFPTCSEKHFIGYATEQRQKAGEVRRKKKSIMEVQTCKHLEFSQMQGFGCVLTDLPAFT